MREIKFRGLTDSEPAKWVYGYYARNVFGDHIIITQDYYEDGSVRRTDSFIVLPETVGQFMGVKDSKGVDVYEGDNVICHPENKYGRRVVKFDFYNGFNKGDGGVYEIIGSIHSPATANS